MLSARAPLEKEHRARVSSRSPDQEQERDPRSGKGGTVKADKSAFDGHSQQEQQDQDTPASTNTSDKIYVGHLSSSVQKRDLEGLFEQYGRLLSVEVKYGGFAFIHFEAQADAEEAVRALHDFVLDGRKLTVEFSVKKGSAASNECLVCGVAGHWARECPDNKDKGLDIKSGKCFKCGNSGHLAKYCRNESKSGSATGGDDRGSNRHRDRSSSDYRSSSRASHVSNLANQAPSSSAYPPLRHYQHPSAPVSDYQYSCRDYRERDRDYARPPPSSLPLGGGGGRDRDNRGGRSAMFDYPNRRPKSPTSPRRYGSSGHLSSAAAAHPYYQVHAEGGSGINNNHRGGSHASPGYEYGGPMMRRDQPPRQDYDYRSHGQHYEDDGLPPPPSYRRADMSGQYSAGDVERGYYSSRRPAGDYNDAPLPRREYDRGSNAPQPYRGGSSYGHNEGYSGRRGGDFEYSRR